MWLTSLYHRADRYIYLYIILSSGRRQWVYLYGVQWNKITNVDTTVVSSYLLRDGIEMIIGIKRVLASRDKITDHYNNIIRFFNKNRFIFLICIISTLCARVETERNYEWIILLCITIRIIPVRCRYNYCYSSSCNMNLLFSGWTIGRAQKQKTQQGIRYAGHREGLQDNHIFSFCTWTII